MFKSIKNLPWIGDSSGSNQNHTTSITKHKGELRAHGLQGLIGDGPPRLDGSDRFFGIENTVGVRNEPPSEKYGNTCYCNSILQCLYYSKPFRETIVSFPARGQQPYQPPSQESLVNGAGKPLVRVTTEPLPTSSAAALAAAKQKYLSSPTAKDEKKKPLPAAAMVQLPGSGQAENRDSPEYKKKKALENGPVLDIDQGNNAAYGMEESLYTALKDMFESIMANGSRTGVVKPNKFLEILRRENEMFNGQQHQDAHEFLNYVMNQVIENVEAHQKKMVKNGTAIPKQFSGTITLQDTASTVSTSTVGSSATSGWIHELFQGQLTSETKCLTCENVSRRDEHFLDLSIDLEKNSSVTSCLRNFSASEMLCERNKFHCDACGGLQEAEKRMKIKRLPKVLALHLKRFKYMESTGRFEKLHYRVLYPYHLRLFNTTDDAEDPDRLYELYAVVVHIGGGPYHGHYVAIIKTEDKGWLLFDDELVEPVDKAYVRNFFGEKSGPGVASAYVLFYQETTLEAVQREMWADEQEAAEQAAAEAAEAAAKMQVPLSPKIPNGHAGANGHVRRLSDDLPSPTQAAKSSPLLRSHTFYDGLKSPTVASHPAAFTKSRKERERERKEEKEREKAEKAERKAAEKEKESDGKMGISRFRNTSKSLRHTTKWLSRHLEGEKEKDAEKDKDRRSQLFPADVHVNQPPPTPEMRRESIGILPPQPPGTPTVPPVPPVPLCVPEPVPLTVAFPVYVPPPVQKENLPLQPPPKEEKKEKVKDKNGSEKRLHHRRPSLFGLRKKAEKQPAVAAE